MLILSAQAQKNAGKYGTVVRAVDSRYGEVALKVSNGSPRNEAFLAKEYRMLRILSGCSYVPRAYNLQRLELQTGSVDSAGGNSNGLVWRDGSDRVVSSGNSDSFARSHASGSFARKSDPGSFARKSDPGSFARNSDPGNFTHNSDSDSSIHRALQGHTCLTMEWLDGLSLKQISEYVLLTERELNCLAGECFRGLRLIHGADIIHKDLHPGNIFLCKDGRVKIIDFGAAGSRERAFRLLDNEFVLNGYESPGLLEGWSHYTESSDIYSLALSLYAAYHGTKDYEYSTLDPEWLPNALEIGTRRYRDCDQVLNDLECGQRRSMKQARINQKVIKKLVRRALRKKRFL